VSAASPAVDPVDVVDVAIVGGGIAGLSVAQALAGTRRVRLFESEPLLAAHASGRNAAIFRPLEHDATSAALTRETLRVLGGLVAPLPLPLRPSGLVLCAASEAALQPLSEVAQREGVRAEWLAGAQLAARLPVLARGEVRHALWVPDGGVLDIHAVTSALAAAARRAGAELTTGNGVAAIELRAGRVSGLRLQDGSELACEAVVLAAGAWSAALGARIGAPLPLTPERRHLVQLAVRAPLAADHPVVWRVDDELYFRPETGGVLASPCDATPFEATADPAVERVELERLADKLARAAPGLAAASSVRSHWACLRTFAPDRELVVGADPRVAGLYWLAGLGGRGMGVALGAAQVLAAILGEKDHPLQNPMDPARLLR
jgi:D-arginine dehydrogenase